MESLGCHRSPRADTSESPVASVIWGVKQKGLFENTNSLGKINQKGGAVCFILLVYKLLAKP